MIVEEEAENGKERADYGKSLIQELSGILSKEFGNGNSATKLKQMRTFFLSYQKRQTLSDESGSRTQKITQIKVNDWMWTYNNYRTPESLDSLPPTIFILKYGKLQPHPAGQTVFPHPHIRTATTIKVKSCFGIELSRGSLQGHWVVINQWWLDRCICDNQKRRYEFDFCNICQKGETHAIIVMSAWHVLCCCRSFSDELVDVVLLELTDVCNHAYLA